MLAADGLSDRGNSAAHLLSGGEQKLLTLLSVLIMEPRYIIFDEPMNSLDLAARRRLSAIMEGWNRPSSRSRTISTSSRNTTAPYSSMTAPSQPMAYRRRSSVAISRWSTAAPRAISVPIASERGLYLFVAGRISRRKPVPTLLENALRIGLVRILIEIDFVRFQLRIELAAPHLTAQPSYVAFAGRAEAQHAAEQLQRIVQPGIIVILADLDVPATAEIEDAPVEMPDLLVVLVVERVILPDADPVASQPVEARAFCRRG